MKQNFYIQVLSCLIGCLLYVPLSYSQESTKSWNRLWDKHFGANSVYSESAISFSLRYVKGNKLQWQKNGQKKRIPASTVKVLTAWYVYKNLGLSAKDLYLFTDLGYTGEVRGDTLFGNLVVKGGGDPAFASRYFGINYSSQFIFRTWSQVIQNMGIRYIQGNVYLIANERTTLNSYMLWEDVGNYYAGGGGCRFTCYDNQYSLYFKGDSLPGRETKVLYTVPVRTGIEIFVNEVKTGPRNSSDQAYIFGSPNESQRTIRGTYPAGVDTFSIRGLLPNSWKPCIDEFKVVLEKNDVQFLKKSQFHHSNIDSKNIKYVRMHRHRSPSVSQLLTRVLKNSDNFYTEQLFYVATQQSQESFKAETLEKKYASLGTGTLVDVTGLSRLNEVSTNEMTRALVSIAQSAGDNEFESFLELPNGFQKKDRVKRFYGVHCPEGIWLKTGSMKGIFSVAGYLTTNRGNRMSFQFTGNHLSQKTQGIKKEIGNFLSLACREL